MNPHGDTSPARTETQTDRAAENSDKDEADGWDESCVLLDGDDLHLLQVAQDGIEITSHPFSALGQPLGISEEEVISRLNILAERGIVRRFSATIGHRALGITANAMIAWRVPPDDVDRVGRIMASFEEVTHCYERDSYPHWPYNLYTMVHSRTRDECERAAEQISKACGIREYRILFSVKEYKKTSARI